jgi:hypothetical protein
MAGRHMNGVTADLFYLYNLKSGGFQLQNGIRKKTME